MVLKPPAVAAHGIVHRLDDVAAHGEVFQDLGYGADAVAGGVEEGVQGLGGFDEEGGVFVGVAGEGHVVVHE